MRKKVYLIVLQMSLLALAVGSVSSVPVAAAQSSQNSACDHASTFLVGRLGDLPRVKGLIHDICDFRVRMNRLNSNITRFDRRFIEHAIAGNMLEIQTLEFTLARTTDPELRGLLQMMITMHRSDLEMALEVAERIRAETEPDLTNMRVYPQTPLYDLGVRRINLVARFLDPLMSGAGGTVTPVPTNGTVVPTGTGTVLPSQTPTTAGTNTPVVTATRTGTPVVTNTVVGTVTGTATGTVVATGTGTTATGTVTAVGTGTTTPLATGTGTVAATGTVTTVPTGTRTTVPTGTATVAPTGTSTIAPTVLPPTRPDFTTLALHILEDEHVMHMEVALVAQRLARNSEIRAFAKHAADVAQLHLLLIDDLRYRLEHNITLPEPQFQEDYQSPRRLEAEDTEE